MIAHCVIMQGEKNRTYAIFERAWMILVFGVLGLLIAYGGVVAFMRGPVPRHQSAGHPVAAKAFEKRLVEEAERTFRTAPAARRDDRPGADPLAEVEKLLAK